MKMTFDSFAKIEPSWLSSDKIEKINDPVVLMSCVTVRRNLKDFIFPGKAPKSQLFDTAAILLASIGKSDVWDNCDFRMIDSLDDVSKNLLLETKTISPLMSMGGSGRFLIRDDNGSLSCMINEEDHLCVSSINPGLSLTEAFQDITSLEHGVDFEFASDPVLGFLTANPNNAGSGLRAHVMLHLPALDSGGEIQRVIAAFERDWKNVLFSKLMSDANNNSGSFYLVTNRLTLGVTPDEIMDAVEDAAQSLVSKEMFARHTILNTKGPDMKDRFWRAWGLLRHARKLSFTEAINKVSFVKLGSDLGILPTVDDRQWRRMVVGAQRYHIYASGNRIIEPTEEPFIRASMFRQFIEKNSANSKKLPCASNLNKELQS